MSALDDRNSFEQYVKRNRVFILGTGFSAGAGIPLTEELLARSMRKFSTECPGIFSSRELRQGEYWLNGQRS